MEKIHEKPNELDKAFPQHAHIIKFNGNELRMNHLPIMTHEEAECITKVFQLLIDEGMTYGRMEDVLSDCKEILKFASTWEEMKEAPTFE